MTRSRIVAVYEKYKHLDGPLSDPEWCTYGEGAAIYAIAGELWRAVKEARSQPTEFIPNYYHCLHKEIRNGVEFCHFHDREIHATLMEHDAAIAAQATEAENKRVLDLVIKEAQTAREENRKIGRATIDDAGKEYRRGCAVGNKEIGEYAESLRSEVKNP